MLGCSHFSFPCRVSDISWGLWVPVQEVKAMVFLHPSIKCHSNWVPDLEAMREGGRAESSLDTRAAPGQLISLIFPSPDCPNPGAAHLHRMLLEEN